MGILQVVEEIAAAEEQGFQWIPVTSSNVAEVGYNARDSILAVIFKSGSQYNYLDVPQEVFINMVNAPSVGKFHHAFIKHSYTYSRVA